MATSVNLPEENAAARAVISRKLRFRECAALGVAPALFGGGVLLTALSARRVRPALATYLAGIALVEASAMMVIAWNAASGHGDLINYSAADHERICDLLEMRIGDVEMFEQKLTQFLERVVDELAHRRMQHGS